MSDPFFEKIYEFKMTAKQMENQAAKSKKTQDFYTGKLKQAIQQNNMTLAKQYGEQAVRARKDVNRYQTIGAKVNTISQKLNQAYKNHQLTSQMASLVNKMSGMNFNAVNTLETLENFEKVFDNVDVQTKMMDDVLDNIGVGTVNDQEVNDLLMQCAEGQANKIDAMMTGPNREALNKQRVGNQMNYNYNQVGNNYFP